MAKKATTQKAKLVKDAPSRTFFSSLSTTQQDILCIAALYLLTFVFFRGIILENAAFDVERDTANATTFAKVGNEISQKEGGDVLWMPNFFSGMPTFGNVHYLPHDVNYVQSLVVKILNLLYLNGKWTWFCVFYLLSGVFMFFLMRVWKVSPIPALLAAMTFMLSPYAIGLAQEGHGSKLMALTYLPVVFMLTHLVLERRDLITFGLLAASIGTLALTNHMQIVYYAFIVIGLYLMYHVVVDLKEDKLLASKKGALFVGALLLGLCISAYIYLSVYEYSTYSIRGGGTAGSTGGLTYDYATNWSMNPWELLTLLVPSFFGFSSKYLGTFQGQLRELPLYWGTMPFNTSSVYVGVVPLFLSTIAVIYRRNKITIFFMILSAIVLLMSFGKHFSIFYTLLFNYLPFFNKFRAPSMIMHLIAFTTAFLGAYGLEEVLQAHERKRESELGDMRKKILYVAGGFVVLPLLGYLLYGALGGTMFIGPQEAQHYDARTLSILKDLRSELLWSDFFKFVVMTAAIGGALFLFLSKKIQTATFSAVILAVLLIDLWIIGAKYVNPKPSQNFDLNFQADATVNFLKQQPGVFRVFPVGELYNETIFAYHGLQSVGGYSPAKLKIYQTMVDSCMYKGADPGFPLNMNIVNMLNVKYLIAQGQLPAGQFELVNADDARRLLTFLNPKALPRAWVLGSVVLARNQTDVFHILNSPEFNPATTAVLEKELPQPIRKPDSAAATLVTFKSREITVSTYASSPALLVLSEIYYPAGWKAFVDGAETEVYKTNYILRSVVIPGGKHEIVFKFDPPTYRTGWILSNVSWAIAALCILLGLWQMPSVRARVLRKGPEQQV